MYTFAGNPNDAPDTDMGANTQAELGQFGNDIFRLATRTDLASAVWRGGLAYFQAGFQRNDEARGRQEAHRRQIHEGNDGIRKQRREPDIQ